ncbi:tyrosine-type recombinase/integrase [Rhodococcus maanshanensis]|uniref:Site-specific recombinase XerD n=1 Tax=Rhodococcus maanshanensis TaxID=183556 RepID=A0A1H7LSH9_9NOCA|nr:tyrosine-type recombinase/integrase [Rhodococcus maanshanensis]SEL01688.1 Site-specific recombinase XerD [Rhodococcus maanshanensis]
MVTVQEPDDELLPKGSRGHERLSPWFGEFLIHRSTAKPSPNTLKAYRQDYTLIADALARAVGVSAAELTLAALDKTTMRTAFADYALTHQAASIRRCWSTWNMLCDFLFSVDAIVANPMSAVLRPKAPKTLPKAFRADSVERLVATLQSADDNGARAWPERDLAVILTGLLTGMRSAELIAVDLGDLRDAVDDGDGHAKVIHVHGKGNKERVVTVEPAVVDVLGDYLVSRSERFPDTARRRPRADVSPWERFTAADPMFVGGDGQRITRGTLQYRVERAYRRAGINGDRAKGALVHQLRHTFATAMADQNVSIYTLMRMLGHESMNTTQRYTAGAGASVRDAAALNPAYQLVTRGTPLPRTDATG